LPHAARDSSAMSAPAVLASQPPNRWVKSGDLFDRSDSQPQQATSRLILVYDARVHTLDPFRHPPAPHPLEARDRIKIKRRPPSDGLSKVGPACRIIAL